MPGPLPSSADRLLVVMSDIEMGAGGPYDDFPQSAWLAEQILRYNEPPYDAIAVDLVFNGDTFDLLKTSFEGAHTHLVDWRVATGKMTRIADAHPAFFEGVKRFLDHYRAPRRVHFIVGNHDAELLFPQVREVVSQRIGGAGALNFPGFELDIGRVHLEHGQQADPMFRMEPPYFHDHPGGPVLALSWGAVAILEVAMPMRPIFYHHDRLKPREELFRLMPEAREYIVNAFWEYWRRDWRGWLRGGDPVKQVGWTMLQEVAFRFSTKSATIHVDKHFRDRLHASNAYDAYLFGHEHEAGLWAFANRRVVRTDCIRNEYALFEDGTVQEQLPVGWAEVFLRGDHVLHAHLVEVDPPPVPEGYMTDSIFDVLEQIRPLLGPRDRRRQVAQERAEREREEADG